MPSDASLWTLPGCNCHTYLGDWLHTVHLGVLLFTEGSILDEICDSLPGTKDQRLQALMAELQVIFAELGRRPLCHLTRAMFESHGQSFACLRHVRASDARNLLEAVSRLAQRHHHGTEHDDHRAAVCDHLLKAEALLRQPGQEIWLGPAEKEQLAWHTEVALLHYGALAVEAMRQGVLRWAVTPKFHYMWHLGCHNGGLNPRAVWTYRFEDFMGRMVQSCSRSTAATTITGLGNKVVQQYSRAMSLRLLPYAA